MTGGRSFCFLPPVTYADILPLFTISIAHARMLLSRSTHSGSFSAFRCSVMSCACFICSAGVSGRSCALFINGRATCDKAFGFKAFRESYENPPKGNKPLMDCGFQFCSVIVSCRSRQGICPVISAIEPKLSYMAFPLPCPLRFMPAGDRPAFRDGPGRFPPGSAAPRACPECWGYRPFAP